MSINIIIKKLAGAIKDNCVIENEICNAIGEREGCNLIDELINLAEKL